MVFAKTVAGIDHVEAVSHPIERLLNALQIPLRILGQLLAKSDKRIGQHRIRTPA